jgi:hypothetical protein
MTVKRKKPEVLSVQAWLLALLLCEQRYIHVDGQALVIKTYNIFYNNTKLIPIGTPKWYEWIERNTRFNFSAGNAGCLFQKEKRGNYFYWYAYKWHTNKRKAERVYVGKLAELSPREITAKAMELERMAQFTKGELSRRRSVSAQHQRRRKTRQDKARTALREDRARRG